MFFAIIFVLAIILVLLMGGSFQNLKSIKLNFIWLVFVALIIKVFLFSNYLKMINNSEKLFPLLYSVSLILVVLFVIFNIKLKGFGILGLGLACNTIVIISNGGYMPVKNEYILMISTSEDLQKIQTGLPASNFIPVTSETRLSFLADIFAMPDWIPISKVFSIGDVLITIGGLVFLFHYSLKNKKSSNLN